MDEITRQMLANASKAYPGFAIRMTHQFLDGTDGKPCGLVPNDWHGGTVTVTGQWWNNKEQ